MNLMIFKLFKIINVQYLCVKLDRRSVKNSLDLTFTKLFPRIKTTLRKQFWVMNTRCEGFRLVLIESH